MTGVRAVALAVCALLAAASSVESAVVQEAALRIVVLEGDDRVNIIEGGTTVPTRVEVRDREDLPVSGASVQFQLEEDGPATLNGGLRQVTLTTDALGQAAVTVNLIASGAAQLSVTATFQGQTTTEVIVHTNFATVAEAEAAGVEAPADVGRETGGAVGGDIDVGGDTGGDAGGVVAADGGLGTGAMVGILGGVGAAVGVGVAVAGGGSSPTPTPTPTAASVASGAAVCALATDADGWRPAVGCALERAGVQRGGDHRLRRSVSGVWRGVEGSSGGVSRP